MSVNTIPGQSRRRISLFNKAIAESKSDYGYDTSKSYPTDYTHSLENEIQQWNDLMKTVNDEYLEARKEDKKSAKKTVDVNVDRIKENKDFGDFFDHSMYYDYINTVEHFCTKVNCAIEMRKVKKRNAELRNKHLMRKCKLIDLVMEEELKKSF